MFDNVSILVSTAEFGQIFSEYKPFFVIIARSYVRDEMVAEDLVTDSFMAFWEKREILSVPLEKVPSYILASIKNRCLNWLRDQKRHMLVHQNILSTALRITEARIATLEAFDPTPVFVEEISEIIRSELEKMPEMIRLIFISSRYHDKTYREIADEFGITINQVEFAIYKATNVFRAALGDYFYVAIAAVVITSLHI